jgi:hypothetical protein
MYFDTVGIAGGRWPDVLDESVRYKPDRDRALQL